MIEFRFGSHNRERWSLTHGYEIDKEVDSFYASVADAALAIADNEPLLPLLLWDRNVCINPANKDRHQTHPPMVPNRKNTAPNREPKRPNDLLRHQ
jgi:hypothetical protein